MSSSMAAIGKSYETTPAGGVQEVRYFTDSALSASVNNALKALDETVVGTVVNGAVLQLEKNEAGWNAAVAAKLNGHWSVAVAYHRADWGHALGTTVKFAW
jgi:hypothetical protein